MENLTQLRYDNFRKMDRQMRKRALDIAWYLEGLRYGREPSAEMAQVALDNWNRPGRKPSHLDAHIEVRSFDSSWVRLERRDHDGHMQRRTFPAGWLWAADEEWRDEALAGEVYRRRAKERENAEKARKNALREKTQAAIRLEDARNHLALADRIVARLDAEDEAQRSKVLTFSSPEEV